jgi:hypothetical protein
VPYPRSMDWANLAVAIVAALATLVAAYFAYIPIRGRVRRRRSDAIEHREDSPHVAVTQEHEPAPQEHEPPVRESSAIAESRINRSTAFAGYLAAGLLVIGVIAGLILLVLHTSRSSASGTSVQECAGGGPIVFVVSGRQNSPAPALTNIMLAGVAEAINDGSPIAIVDLDGNPKLIFSETFYQPSRMLEGLQERKFAVTVSNVRAKSPGADVLDALNVAGDWVRSECNRGGSVYLEDSGLQVVEPLDFRMPGLMEENPARIVKSLIHENELPYLNGMNVVLAGIGDTAPPQHRLSTAQQKNLREIWSAIVTAAGAKQPVQVDFTPRGEPAPSHVPPVQLVPVP